MRSLVDREDEVRALRTLAASEGRHLALLYGRRRIGKTFLLTHAWDEGRPVLYYTSSATSPEINRRALMREAREWSGEDLREDDYPSWRSVFRTLFGLRPAEPVVIVLDEFQYLASSEMGLRELASELNAVWEGRIDRQGALLVVLSGSSLQTMRALEAGGSPIFGRLDWRCALGPFDYYDAGRMVPGYPSHGRVLAYAAFGGTPQYLAAVDDARSLEANIIDLMLATDGKVRIQVESALEQEEGLRDASKYRAILASVGLGRRDIGQVAASLGQRSDSALKRMFKELVRLGYLEEERNYGAPRNQATRYRMADPAQRFYYGLVLPNISAIASSGPERVWKERLSGGKWSSYVGREVFEDVVRQAYLRRLRADAHDVHSVDDWSRWEGLDRNRSPVEIDIVTRLVDGRMLTGAVKFRDRPASARVFLDHVHALERLAASGQGWARHALEPRQPFLFVSSGGFKPSFLEARGDEHDRAVLTWTLDDLFAPA